MCRIKEQMNQVLAKDIGSVLLELHLDFNQLQEIRLRTGQPLSLIYQGEEVIPGETEEHPFIVKDFHISETLEYVSNYSLYAYEGRFMKI